MFRSKWFAGPGENRTKKPEPQQAKLKLQSLDSRPKNAAASEPEEITSDHEDVEMPDASVEPKSEGESEVEVAQNTSRKSDRNDTPSDDDDDAPPSKRRRTTAQNKGTNGTASKASMSKSAINGKGKATARIPAAKTSSAKKAAPVDNKEVKNERDGEELAVSGTDKAIVKPAEATPEDEGEASVSEHEPEEQEDDEDKPEEAAKAREKVLVALKSSGKDPYPDWKAGEDVPYAALCATFHKIEMTTKRLEILAHCSLFLRQVLRLTPTDLLETILLMINKLGADYTGIELGIGESLIMKAIGESTGRSLAVIKADQQEIGDLGMVAAKSRGNQPTMFKPKALTVKGVFKGLKDIATIEGHGSQGRKVAGIKKLLSSADAANAGKGNKVDITKEKGGPSEAKYIVRTLEGKLRLGLAEKSVLVALAQAVVFHREEYLAAAEKKKLVAPTTEELARGETILKSVYRYVLYSNQICRFLTGAANCQATKQLYQRSSLLITNWRSSPTNANFSPEYLSSLCLQNPQNPSLKSWTASKASISLANTSMTENELKFILLHTLLQSSTQLRCLRPERARRELPMSSLATQRICQRSIQTF
jgi:DNA ligase 1